MLKRFLYFNFLFLLAFSGCKSFKIPENLKPAPNPVLISYENQEDSLIINIENRIKSPVQIKIDTEDKYWDKKIQAYKPIVLQAEQDTSLLIVLNNKKAPKMQFKAALGDPQKTVIYPKISLPIPANKAVQIIQGHHGTYSHNKASSKYAIDFKLKVGDTVFAAYEGFAVRVIEGFTKGGKDERLLDYGNNIIIYNQETGLFFQYSHLKYLGALVEVGDWVKQGQPIGISGMTGYTDIPHLHFNVLAPDPYEMQLISVPVDFIEGYFGKDLQKNTVIKK